MIGHRVTYPAIGLLLLAAVGLAACSSPRCGLGDWCACSGGTVCLQSCDDTDGCRFFCDHMNLCGATCGDRCNFDFHDATTASATCGDACHISCHGNMSCGAFCGAECDYTSFDTQRSDVRAGENSRVSCTNVEQCKVECLGDCHVFCADQVDQCDVTCPNGGSPTSCPDGSLACGPC